MTGYVSSLDLSRHGPWWWRLLGQIGSVRTAAVLIAVIAVVISAATVYETRYGPEAVAQAVYRAWWFAGIFLVLAACVAAAALLRLPWRRRHLGFVTVHTGLCLLIAGFLVGRDRLDGMLACVPGTPATQIALPIDHLGVVVDGRRWSSGIDPRPHLGYPTLGRFLLAPVWPLAEPGITHAAAPVPLLLAADDGPRVDLLAAIDCAAEAPGREAASVGEPAFHVAITGGPPGQQPETIADRWLSLRDDPLSQGPATVTVATTASTAFFEAFAKAEPPPAARLRVWWAGAFHDVPLTADAIGKESSIAPDLTLRIEQYVERPRFSEAGLVSDEAADLNPVIAVAVRIGQDPQWKPLRTTAYGLVPSPPGMPELLLEHPVQYQAQPGRQGLYLQALAGPDGRSHVRWFTRSRGLAGGGAVAPGGSWQGDLLPAGAAMQLRANVSYLPATRPAPVPEAMLPTHHDRASRWLLLRVSWNGRQDERWVRRGDRAAFTVDGRQVLVSYAQAVHDLRDLHGFAVRLERFDEGRDPGGMRSASFASDVTVIDTKTGESRQRISMNEPLAWNGVTLYQTSFSPETDAEGRPTGRSVSHFTVATDPGLPLKYLGSLVLCLGIALWYLLRR